MKKATQQDPFRVIVADPPWPFRDKLPGPKRGAEKHYRIMSVPEIMRFELPPIADDALLFLWRVAAMGEDAYKVMRVWGFEPKAEMVWAKTAKGGGLHFGMGHYTRGCHEVCLIGRRGNAKVRDRSVRSVFYADVGRHSQKPERFFKLVEQLSEGPYCELFARRYRKGWSSYGLELVPQNAA